MFLKIVYEYDYHNSGRYPSSYLLLEYISDIRFSLLFDGDGRQIGTSFSVRTHHDTPSNIFLNNFNSSRA
jgi:hypothetical protein